MRLFAALRDNPKLVAGIAVIGGILWVNALLDLSEANNALAATLRQKNLEISRLEAQAGQAHWLERADLMRGALAAAQARAWSGDSIAIARAAFQDWLSLQLAQAKAGKPLVKMAQSESSGAPGASPGSELPEGLLRLRATVEFETNPRAMQELLKAMATGEQTVAVEALKLARPRTEMTVAAWYSANTATPGAPATAAAAD